MTGTRGQDRMADGVLVLVGREWLVGTTVIDT
jgi:hypothetical protein